MTRFLTHWFVVGVALAVAAWVLPGVAVRSPEALLIGSLVLGLVNASVRPVLTWLTLPFTIVTLGAFYLVVNGAAFALAAWLVPGFTVQGPGAAVLGALLVSAVSWFASRFLRDEKPAHPGHRGRAGTRGSA